MKVVVILALFIAAAASFPLKGYEECGQNKYGGSCNKIVGGQDACPNEFPYQVSLHRKQVLQFKHTCGGSIINNQWILSAAHCFSDSTPANWKVVAGMHKLESTDDTQVTLEVSKIIRHPEYNAYWSNVNDITLMKLKEPIVFNENIRPVCLPQPSTFPDGLVGEGAIATGWGTTSEGGTLANTLQKVTVPIISNGQCQMAYTREVIRDSMICAGNLVLGGIDACQGDSGGPLAYFDATAGNNSYVQVGITSWGYGCAQKGYPGVYTRVSEFYDWIWKTVTSN